MAKSRQPEKRTREASPARRWLFRCAAVLLGLSVFAAIELGCRLSGLGEPVEIDDPFVGFSDVQPLFELDESGTRFRTSPALGKFFNEDSFAARKSKGTFRIFCLGGSTVQGRPFQKETSFTTFLQQGLEAADSSRDWEVINCGGISYARDRKSVV